MKKASRSRFAEMNHVMWCGTVMMKFNLVEFYNLYLMQGLKNLLLWPLCQAPHRCLCMPGASIPNRDVSVSIILSLTQFTFDNCFELSDFKPGARVTCLKYPWCYETPNLNLTYQWYQIFYIPKHQKTFMSPFFRFWGVTKIILIRLLF